MGRIVLAFRCFFVLLFRGTLPDDVIARFAPTKAPVAAPPALPAAKTSDGALQILSILQRDSRLIDFLMEDISGAADDQIGAAVREVHEQCRQSLGRYVRLSPVIDGVEGTFTKTPGLGPAQVKFLGNVPAQGRPAGGTLRHKGWRVEKVELPPVTASQDVAVIAPAEIEIE